MHQRDIETIKVDSGFSGNKFCLIFQVLDSLDLFVRSIHHSPMVYVIFSLVPPKGDGEKISIYWGGGGSGNLINLYFTETLSDKQSHSGHMCNWQLHLNHLALGIVNAMLTPLVG